MNELEAVELKLSEVLEENHTFRFDSEFVKKDYLENIIKIKNYLNGFITFKEILNEITGGATPLGANYPENGVPFLRVQNIMQNYFDLNDIAFISKEDDVFLKRSRLKKNDVLLTITGVSYGKAAVVTEKLVNANINQHSVRMQLKKDTNPFFVSTFLNSRFGKLQSDKNVVGVTRPALDYQAIKKFIVPNLSIEFQENIERLIIEAFQLNEQTKNIYRQAETLLLNELGLQNWQPTQANTEVKSFKNSFLQSGRLDAEYYQPKYDELISKVKQTENYTLIDLVKIKKSIEPGSAAYMEEGIPFIRVANLSKFGLTDPDIHLAPTKEIENLFLKKDTILLSKDGSVGIAYKMEEDMQAVTSGAILHLTVNNKKILPDYLTLVLNSKLTQLQAERDAGGSIIQHWRMNEIENVLIPVIALEKQHQIAQLIQQSFSLKKQSRQLLQTAKQAVEKAIEEGEEAGMEFIKTRNSFL